jgi:putative cell wall-binding protein
VGRPTDQGAGAGSVDRREFLRRSVIGAGALALYDVASPQWLQAAEGDAVRVYLIVIDGLRPDEVALMPQLSELAAAGTYFPASRAQMIAETTTNHVSMMTGMRADRTGMPGNGVPFLGEVRGEDTISYDPRYLQADSVFTLATRQAPGLKTAAVNAKGYIIAVQAHDRTGDDEVDATEVNDDSAVIPIAETTPDIVNGDTAVRISRDLDPDFLWVSFGDVDRMGHVDETGSFTGGQAPLARTTVLQTADLQVRRIVEELVASDRWGSTVFLVTSDHGMDWSFPDRIVDLAGAFDADADLAGEYVVALNGGAAMYALLSPNAPGAPARLEKMRAIALAADGVDEALYARPNAADGGSAHSVGTVHPDWALTGDHVGDLVVTVESGWRLNHDGPFTNPIPGNHGHVPTLPIPVIVAGGHPAIRQQVVAPPAGLGDGDRSPTQAENIDMGPTVAWLLGLNPPPGGFDGRVLDEAFTSRPSPRVASSPVASLAVVRRVAGDDRYATAAALSADAFPDGAGGGDDEPQAILASGGDFPDALAATPLAIRGGVPLLLVERGALPAATLTELRRLEATRVLLVGGERAVSADVVTALESAGIAVERVGGEHRYDTARLLSERVGVDALHRGAVVVSGTRYADAVASGAWAGHWQRPILLADVDRVPAATLTAIEDLGLRRVTLVGGTGVLSDAVANQLAGLGLVVERIAGADRYATSAAVLERHVREGGLVHDLFLASGGSYPDALAAGAAAGARGAGLLLVPPDALGSGPTAASLTARADQFVRLTIAGGPAAVSTAVQSAITDRLRAIRTRSA